MNLIRRREELVIGCGNAAVSSPISASLAGCRAIVVFSGSSDIWWLRMLRPGFKHCYAVVELRDQWLVYNPASHRTDILVFGAYPLATMLDRLNVDRQVVACVRVRDVPKRMAPIRPFSCVEAVKRLLGIQARCVLTPWSLYKHLIENA